MGTIEKLVAEFGEARGGGAARRKLLSVKDLAKILKRHPVTIYADVKRGDIPHLRIGRAFRFDPRAIEALLRRGTPKKGDIKLITVKEAQGRNLLGDLSLPQLYALMRGPTLPPGVVVKVGRRRFLDEAALRAFLAAGGSAAPLPGPTQHDRFVQAVERLEALVEKLGASDRPRRVLPHETMASRLMAAEAAPLIGVTPKTLREWANAGRFPPGVVWRFDRQLRFDPVALIAWRDSVATDLGSVK